MGGIVNPPSRARVAAVAVGLALLLPALPGYPAGRGPREPQPAKRAATVRPPAGEGHGVNVKDLDRSVSPCKDFYRFADGGWLAGHPIPPDEPMWDSFVQLRKKTGLELRKILEQAKADKDAPRESEVRKLGDFYATGMDMKARDAEGLTPLAPELARIDAIKNLKELQAEIAHLQITGVDAVFQVTSGSDLKDSDKVICQLAQGGLGLPSPKYYLSHDKASKEVMQMYRTHIRKMFELMGDPVVQAKVESDTVVALETRLARSTVVFAPKIEAFYHVMDRRQMGALTPHFDWGAYFKALNHPDIKSANVSNPEFFKALDKELARVPVTGWKTYLRWRLVSSLSPFLSTPFVKESLTFRFEKVIGTSTLPPLWRQVVTAENEALGFPLGRLYVTKYFRPEAKAQAEAILHNVREALREDLKTLDWMSASTRKAALTKLDMMVEKVGYPEIWPDYAGLKIDRGPYVLNVLRARAFQLQRELNRIGKPADRSRWTDTPQTVNARYIPSMNAIFFPAAILQPPFFDPKADAASNYGAIGAAMGHEITHGFDPTGSHFDGKGDLKNWWTKRDRKAFEKQVRRIVRQFSKYKIEGGLHVNGSTVANESVADLGGLTLAYRAFEKTLQRGPRPPDVDGFTAEQRFFLAFARIWAAHIRPGLARMLALSDPHPPPRYRVDGTLADMPAFARAWGCGHGPMDHRRPCTIW